MIKIAGNIRQMRKDRGMTQEQLAETMGVTVGAVSKWESGMSYPDLNIIVSLASFFETSVDVLLGYEMLKENVDNVTAKIKELRNKKLFEEASLEVEKALQKFPNSFKLAFSGAVLYSVWGVEATNRKAFQRAIVLFNRSLELIEQNKDPKINEWSIKNHIASAHLGLEQTKEALEILKSNNAGGLNSAAIGNVIASELNQPEEAWPYLSEALVDQIDNLVKITSGLSNVYSQQKRNDLSIKVMLWLKDILEGLKPEKTITYLDKITTQLYSGCAAECMEMKDYEKAKEYLVLAVKDARKFDSGPIFFFNNINFVDKSYQGAAFDSFGQTAEEGIVLMFKGAKEIDFKVFEEIWKQVQASV